MKVVRHNWKWSNKLFSHVCRNNSSFGVADEPNCLDCEAAVSWEQYKDLGGDVSLWAKTGKELDRLWHHRLRPMAEFACLVEESNKAS